MGMKRPTKKAGHEQEYWQTIADLLTALLLVVLLIMMILILYIVQLKDVDYTDYYDSEHDGAYAEDDDGNHHFDYDYDVDHKYDHEHDSEGGGGGDGGNGDYEYPQMGMGEREEFGKAAVYVMVIDAETGRTIKEENVVFELYGEKNELMLLNTYYPHKIEYRNYLTTGNGVFYLPEKVELGSYYLHEISEPVGYDASDNVPIHIESTYDWPEPYIVKVNASVPDPSTVVFMVASPPSGTKLIPFNGLPGSTATPPPHPLASMTVSTLSPVPSGVTMRLSQIPALHMRDASPFSVAVGAFSTCQASHWCS